MASGRLIFRSIEDLLQGNEGFAPADEWLVRESGVGKKAHRVDAEQACHPLKTMSILSRLDPCAAEVAVRSDTYV